ncbi:MAG: peptidoglycan DD-metalloendopeptidase family protein [Deltaproteobacteria bacterium]|nr:peptidoglycan DD-metalloendopeptidase family protein [Deltaproteobacteria bacterium]
MIAKLKMIKKIKFSHWLCALLFIAFGILGFRYLKLRQEFEAYHVLYGQSVAMGEQISEIKNTLSTLDQTLNQITKFSSKLKVIARIKKSVEGKKMAEKRKKQELQNPPDLEKMNLKAKDLRSEAQTQAAYLAELVEFFNENETLLTSVPSVKPAQGYVTSRFGFRRAPTGSWQMHKGVDIAANYGTKVMAPADGFVEAVGYSPGYGRHIVLDHGYGVKTVFAHASQTLVKAGQFIKRGTRVALVGRSGHVRGVHLHYEVRVDGVPVDPSDFML